MTRVLMFAIACALLAGCNVADRKREARAEERYTVASGKRDPVICKRVVPTGSHLGQRMCRRQSEWSRMAANARDISPIR